MVPSRGARAAVGAALVMAALAVTTTASAATPVGYLDSAGCDGYRGWAQDPDEPDKHIDVHVYFGGPAGSGAPALAINAGIHRDDLCTAIGSCEHGFALDAPLSLLDGQAREMHAYGIDSQGGPNVELGSSPRALQCAMALPGGERRKIDVASYDRWRFNSYWDVLPATSDQVKTVPEGRSISSEPALRVDDAGAYWVIDGELRRSIEAGALGYWRLDPAAAIAISSDELALTTGPAMRARPVLVIDGGLYLFDEPLPAAPPTPDPSGGDDDGGASGGGDGSGGADATSGSETDSEALSKGACSVTAAGVGERGGVATLISMVALAGLAARRRSRRS